MRQLVDKARLEKFLEAFGNALGKGGKIYLTGGGSAVLHEWRESTIDIDIKAMPEPSHFFESIAKLKDALDINIEIASPDLFIPELPGWESRSLFIARYGDTDFYHYDFYSQALAKLERNHIRDIADVECMYRSGLIKSERLLELFIQIESNLIRFPAIEIETLKDIINTWCDIHS
ncbi:MAG: hypothetical protein HC845_10095 [Akkermansiaceae bacterium]|nr:hypothetical protein [Akkermansiaceae bacterium]